MNAFIVTTRDGKEHSFLDPHGTYSATVESGTLVVKRVDDNNKLLHVEFFAAGFWTHLETVSESIAASRRHTLSHGGR